MKTKLILGGAFLFLGAAMLAQTTSLNTNNASIGGSFNTGIGANALGAASNGDENAAVGYYSLWQNASKYNAAIGYKSLYSNTSGLYNSSIGYGSDVGAGNLTNATAVGANAVSNASNKIRFGDANVTVVEGPVAYTTSDGRFKTNVKAEDVKGLEFIKLLRPVVYNFDARTFTEFLTRNMPEDVRRNYLEKDFSEATAIRQSGFIAQEVEVAAQKSGYNFNGVHVPVNENDNYSLAYGQFVVPLVKAVQEQQQQLEEQVNINKELRTLLQVQQQQINELLAKASNPTGIANATGQLSEFRMEQNIPNPFNNETLISYQLPQSTTSAYMAVYDLSGKQVLSLPLEKKNTSITLTASKLAAGIYIYSIVADGKILDSKRMVVAEK